MPEPIRLDGKYTTRDGRAVRVLCVKLNDPEFPVVAGVFDENGREDVEQFTAAGKFFNDSATHDLDLIPLRVKHTRTVWVNVYPNEGNGSYYATKKLADKCAHSSRIACKEVTFDCYEGEGL